MNVIKVYTLCVVLFSGVFYISAEAHKCFHKKLSKTGICINIDSCRTALENLKNGKYPQNCGFEGLKPLVCCTDDDGFPDTKAAIGHKSLEKCKEYGTAVKKIVDHCKIPAPHSLVMNDNGIPAERKEFPYMVALGYQAENGSITYACAGSLISNDFVLTAAHCCNSREHGKPVVVRIGDSNLNSIEGDEGARNVEILKFIRHPAYKPPSSYNNIAIVQLKDKVVFSDHVYPVCLNTKNEGYGDILAVGWGENWGKPDKVQMKVQLEIYQHKRCSTYFELNDISLRNGISNETQLCAGSQQRTAILCRASNDDSGGPLVELSEIFCMYNLIGVTSIGDACVLERRPRVYSRVTHYLDWIENTVWP